MLNLLINAVFDQASVVLWKDEKNDVIAMEPILEEWTPKRDELQTILPCIESVLKQAEQKERVCESEMGGSESDMVMCEHKRGRTSESNVVMCEHKRGRASESNVVMCEHNKGRASESNVVMCEHNRGRAWWNGIGKIVIVVGVGNFSATRISVTIANMLAMITNAKLYELKFDNSVSTQDVIKIAKQGLKTGILNNMKWKSVKLACPIYKHEPTITPSKKSSCFI